MIDRRPALAATATLAKVAALGYTYFGFRLASYGGPDPTELAPAEKARLIRAGEGWRATSRDSPIILRAHPALYRDRPGRAKLDRHCNGDWVIPVNIIPSHDRLYQDLARMLLSELAAGRFPVGSRLPAERELAAQHGVSRPTVREAIIALEVQGLVEVRIGSGAYVLRLPGDETATGFNVSAFELTEARLLFEAEAAALAATAISDEEITEIEGLVDAIARENLDPKGTDTADRAFHLAIARATRNGAIVSVIESLWKLRYTSPEAALLHAKARTANVKPVVEEHGAILAALRAHDPVAARAAMRAHLSAVLESLLFATEEKAVADARRAAQAKRDRYARATA